MNMMIHKPSIQNLNQHQLFKHRNLKQHTTSQKGAVLITGLIFLVVLTLLVLSVMRGATLEERMAANARNRQVAMQAAEAMLRNVEENVITKPPIETIKGFDYNKFTANCANALCSPPDTGSTPRWQTVDWTNTTTTKTFAAAGDNIAGLANQPRYFVEYMGKYGNPIPNGPCPATLFRITVRGLGSDGAAVILQNNYRHQPHKFKDGSRG